MAFIEKGQEIDMEVIKAETQLSAEALRLKESRDRELADIISGEDDRILLVIGPCSSDNEEAVLEYARRLSALQKKVADKIFMVMRVYTAKPRTNGDGYKGLVHQPDTSKAPSLINGLQAVRQLHYRVITETGLTTADEMLYPSNLILVDDLVSYHAVGARSVEDQEHRFVASGIDAPVGMKNPTSGNLGVMFNAIYAAQNKQTFLYHGRKLRHQVILWPMLSSVEQSTSMAIICRITTMKTYSKPLNAMKPWDLKILLSSLTPTMITQASNIWSRFELFARPCRIVIGMRKLKRRFEDL